MNLDTAEAKSKLEADSIPLGMLTKKSAANFKVLQRTPDKERFFLQAP
jgi:hypothetical protein